MKKILTISIAAYNVEKFIHQTLDSLSIPEVMDQLEVIIENDGSKDSTASIVQDYVDKYPQTFRLINKPNGGYGSTVNRSMTEATGKYFKLLDGDDWVDPKGLQHLVELLENCDSDWVMSRRFDAVEGQPLKEHIPTWAKYEGQTLRMKEYEGNFYPGIWHTTVKTELLQKLHFQLPEHTLYTDQLFIAYMMPYVDTITCDATPVYCYRQGRDEQSVSKASMIRNYKDELKVLHLLVDYYHDCPAITDENRKPVLSRFKYYYKYGMASLLLVPKSTGMYKNIREIEQKAKFLTPDLYKISTEGDIRIRLMHWTGGRAYWLVKGK